MSVSVCVCVCVCVPTYATCLHTGAFGLSSSTSISAADGLIKNECTVMQGDASVLCCTSVMYQHACGYITYSTDQCSTPQLGMSTDAKAPTYDTIDEARGRSCRSKNEHQSGPLIHWLPPRWREREPVPHTISEHIKGQCVGGVEGGVGRKGGRLCSVKVISEQVSLDHGPSVFCFQRGVDQGVYESGRGLRPRPPATSQSSTPGDRNRKWEGHGRCLDCFSHITRL